MRFSDLVFGGLSSIVIFLFNKYFLQNCNSPMASYMTTKFEKWNLLKKLKLDSLNESC
jgi:hypothetical protein